MSRKWAGRDYDIALRPDDRNADPMSTDTLCDDIVVTGVTMFRAEQMDDDTFWVCCYLENGEAIAWDVRAKCKPRRIEWVTVEFPSDVRYEHELES